VADSYAGITVPEGHPDQIRHAAQTFQGVAGGLHGASGDLRSVPGLVSAWKGPASAAFAGTTVTNGGCVDDGAEAMTACAHAATTYAGELEQAQKDARDAIHDARDAQRRIDQANADIEDAVGAQVTAQGQIDSADHQIALSAGAGAPDAGAIADRDAAGTALTNAQNAEGDARRRLQQAQDDLEDAKRRGHKAMKAAKDAAHAATGAFEGVAGHTPAAALFGGSPHAIEDQVLARVRAGDYSVLDSVPLNYLPEDTQRAVAAEIAKESYKTSYGEASHSMEDMAALVHRYEGDDEFATGFYNQLGGQGAYDLASNTYMFHGHGKGLQDPAVIALLTPFAALMATATRSKGSRRDFTDDFIGTDISLRDRLGSHGQLAAFVMAAPAAGYGSQFLSRVGKEILVDPLDSEDVPGIYDISDHQNFMKFMAGNPEAAGLLLAGHHGPDNHFSNVAPLLRYGRYTDDGDALGALIQAGTHDLRGTDLALFNDASHAVIQATPGLAQAIPDGAKHSLVLILDDHIADFDYVAAERAEPGIIDAPSGGISGLSYEEGHDYLKTLVGYDETRSDATKIVGERVAYDMHQAIALKDTSYANSAGSLSEMGVLATADADLDSAKMSDTMNGFAKSAAGKLIGPTPPGKLPGFGEVADKALGQVFSTDAVQHALESQTPDQMDAFGPLKRLSVAGQVNAGQLPVAAMDTVDIDGGLNVNFINGPHGDNDVVPGLSWDLDGDGKLEHNITERQLYDATLGPGEAADDGMRRLYSKVYDGRHPPDIDDLDLPSGLDNDNPSTFEKVWDWPFDAPGEGTISDGSQVVAHQDDLKWDPQEDVYHLPVEGHGELTYKRVGDDWVRVEKQGNAWQPVK
jgi:hypothetical protein